MYRTPPPPPSFFPQHYSRITPTNLFNSVLQRVEHGIGMPFGLQLVRYGGGSDFRFVDAALHVGVEPAHPAPAGANPSAAAAAAEAAQLFARKSALDGTLSFPVRVMVHAMQALAAHTPAMVDMGRAHLWPPMSLLSSAAYWASASWHVQVVAAAPVPGGSRANLYFHGWLFEAARQLGNASGILQPLVGVYSAVGGVEHDRGDGDLLAQGARALNSKP